MPLTHPQISHVLGSKRHTPGNHAREGGDFDPASLGVRTSIEVIGKGGRASTRSRSSTTAMCPGPRARRTTDNWRKSPVAVAESGEGRAPPARHTT